MRIRLEFAIVEFWFFCGARGSHDLEEDDQIDKVHKRNVDDDTLYPHGRSKRRAPERRRLSAVSREEERA